MFAYVQPFKPARGTKKSGMHRVDENIGMFRVTRCQRNHRRLGHVILLTDIWRPIELIPVFGQECNKQWTSQSAVEEAEEFYVNNFADKEVYQSVY